MNKLKGSKMFHKGRRKIKLLNFTNTTNWIESWFHFITIWNITTSHNRFYNGVAWPNLLCHTVREFDNNLKPIKRNIVLMENKTSMLN